MGGATLRNAVKRKTHKERAQPSARRKLGLLEKHADYKARALDYQRKRDTLAALRRKAEQRNPDEFYFAMERARTRGGVAVTESAVPNKYSAAELALMRTQDVRYIASKAATEARKAERLASSLHAVGVVDRPPASHLVFVDDAPAVARFDPVAHFDTPASLLGRAHNRPRRAAVEGGGGASASAAPASSALVVARGGRPDRAAMKADRARAAAYADLERRRARVASLRRVEERLRVRGALQGKGRARRVTAKGSGEGGVYKWARVRKR